MGIQQASVRKPGAWASGRIWAQVTIKHTIKQWDHCLSPTDEPWGSGFFVQEHPGSGPSPRAIAESGEQVTHQFSRICLCLRVTSTAVHKSMEKGIIIFLGFNV